MIPLYPIEVFGLSSKMKIDAAVDTCFEGEVCIPATMGIELGLVLMGREEFEYADGRREIDYIFMGETIFMGEKKPISIVLTQSEQALIGTELIADCTLTIDFPTGRVDIAKTVTSS